MGGLIFTLAGRVPERGEIIRHASGVEFEVMDADSRRVKRLRISDTRRRDSVKPKELLDQDLGETPPTSNS